MIPITREMDTRDALRAIRAEHRRERRTFWQNVAVDVICAGGVLALIYTWLWATV